MMRKIKLVLLVAITLRAAVVQAAPELQLSSKFVDAPGPEARELAASAASKKSVGKVLVVFSGVFGAAAVAGGLSLAFSSCDQDADKCPGKILGAEAMLFGAAGALVFGVAGALVYGSGEADERHARELHPSVAPLATPSGGGGLMLSARF
jgi:hypothetical protein